MRRRRPARWRGRITTRHTIFRVENTGTLIALDRATGAIVYQHQLPTSANAPIAVFGNTVLVPAGGPNTSAKAGGGNPQLVAYTIP